MTINNASSDYLDSQIPFGILLIDLHDKILGLNYLAEELLGYESSGLKGKPVSILGVENAINEFRNQPNHSAALDAKRIITSQIRCKDGAQKPANIILKAQPGPNGPLVMLFEIDEGKSSAAEKQNSQEINKSSSLMHAHENGRNGWDISQYFVNFLDNTPDFIYLKEIKGKKHEFVAVSQSLATLVGYSDWRDMIGLDDFDVFPPEFARRYYDQELEMLENDQQINIKESYLTPEETTGWVHSRKSPVKSAAGHVIGIIGVSRDITNLVETEQALRKAKDQAEAAAKAKAVFLANMSHEIRTPMNSIIGFLGLALEDKGLPDQVREYLEIANGSSESLLRLLNDILDLSKLDAGKVEMEAIRFNLPVLMKKIIRSLEIGAAEKGLSLDLNMHPAIMACREGDPERLKQIIVNLLGNAIKFTKEGGAGIHIKSGDAPEEIRFTITDTGVGIAPEKLDFIMEPFAQSDQSTTRQFGGTGLGTTISKQLIELMGGKIDVVSEQGKGTTFSFSVKMPEVDCGFDCSMYCDEISGKKGEKTTLTTRRQKILVAEDIKANADLVAMRLRAQGHIVTVANDGKKAVEAFQNNPFDIVLMDIHMPVMDGMRATRIIRDMEQGASTHIPIIALTASVFKEDQQKCFDAGVDEIVNKPIEFEKLFAVIEKYAMQAKDGSGNGGLGTSKLDQAIAGTLQGIDFREGLDRWEDEGLFVQGLIDFSGEFFRAAQDIRSHVDNGQWAMARRLAHSLRGVAGNLSLPDVTAAAMELGNALRAEEKEDAKSLAEELNGAMQTAFASIRFLAPIGYGDGDD